MAGLNDLLGQVGIQLPSGQNVAGVATGAFHTITIGIIVILVLFVCFLVGWFFFRGLKFNKKIIIFEKIGNNWTQTGRDKAQELKYGTAGDTVFYLQKRKKYLPRPELQTGKRVYWFAIREDGEWINFTPGDIDLQMKEMKAKFLHPEMRYARTALIRNLKERYDKPKFLEKYGIMLVNIAAIVIILVFMWLIIDKIISVGDKVTSMVNTGKEVMDKVNEILPNLDRICSRSGTIPAG